MSDTKALEAALRQAAGAVADATRLAANSQRDRLRALEDSLWEEADAAATALRRERFATDFTAQWAPAFSGPTVGAPDRRCQGAR